MSSKSRVLIIEDERDIADLMALHLKREGYDVATVDNGEEALKVLGENSYQCLVLDWMLPGLSGLELMKKIRSVSGNHQSKLPILMVTAKAHASDIVLGLETGADDYLTKPFELPVFLARVRALLRRTTEAEEDTAQRWELGNLSIDGEKYQVTCLGKEIQLTPSEFKLLIALAKQQGRVLTRERLIDLVQGEGVSVIDRAIDTHIFGLRKKLGKCADVVETVRGIGYRIKSKE